MNGEIEVLYNEVPTSNQEMGRLYDLLDVIVEQIDEGLHFRIIVEQLLDYEELPEE